MQTRLLADFLNVEWLRPESALWDAIAAHVIQSCGYLLKGPALDLGAGNGLFSFIAAGGSLTLEYDFYVNVGGLDEYWKNVDIYDHFAVGGRQAHIASRPSYGIDYALDRKENLGRQAKFLEFYGMYLIGDANARWPFEDSSLRSVFSNMLYWLRSPEFCFSELGRVLQPGGKGFVCLQDPMFIDCCPTYRNEDFGGYSALLEKLNRGRSQSSCWQLDLCSLEDLCRRCGLRILYHRYYLTELVLRIWDIGLRPLSPVLIKMANALQPTERRKYKEEWIETCFDFLGRVFDNEKDVADRGGYSFLVLERA